MARLKVDEDIKPFNYSKTASSKKFFIAILIALVIIIALIYSSFLLGVFDFENNGNNLEINENDENNFIIEDSLGNDLNKEIPSISYCETIDRLDLSEGVFAFVSSDSNLSSNFAFLDENSDYFIIYSNKEVQEIWENDSDAPFNKSIELIEILKQKGVTHIVLVNLNNEMELLLKNNEIDCFKFSGIIQEVVLYSELENSFCPSVETTNFNEGVFAIPADTNDLNGLISEKELYADYFLIFEDGVLKEAWQKPEDSSYSLIFSMFRNKGVENIVSSSYGPSILTQRVKIFDMNCYFAEGLISEIIN